jgi:mRNA interferase MazF
MEINQYNIVWVNLDPTICSEIKKTRPCVVISPDEMNKYLNTVVIAPVTSQSKSYPTRVNFNNKKISGWIVLDQVRTIDKRRIIKVAGKLTINTINKVKKIIKETYVD